MENEPKESGMNEPLKDENGYTDGEVIQLKGTISIVDTFHGRDTYIELELPHGEKKHIQLW